MNNIMLIGILDNVGCLYYYVKFDFYYLDGFNGSFIVLKCESSFFEFFICWIIWMILLIIFVVIVVVWFINKCLIKIIIELLEVLEKVIKILGKDV